MIGMIFIDNILACYWSNDADAGVNVHLCVVEDSTFDSLIFIGSARILQTKNLYSTLL